jgi:hypothetical protein
MRSPTQCSLQPCVRVKLRRGGIQSREAGHEGKRGGTGVIRCHQGVTVCIVLNEGIAYAVRGSGLSVLRTFQLIAILLMAQQGRRKPKRESPSPLTSAYE